MTTRFHDGQRYELVRTEPYTRTDGGETELSVRQSECPACVSGAMIIAQLVGHDMAQAGDIVARSRSPVFALCRALLAAGANPDSSLECYRGGILALRVKSIGIGATLTVEENATRGPRVARWKAFSRADVEPPIRSNDGQVSEVPA